MKKCINILSVAVVLTLFTGLSAHARLNQFKKITIAPSIFGGSLVDTAFQKKNGIVAVVQIFIENINIKQDGSIDPHAKLSIGLCSGTLIDKKIVLTAAHCLNSETPGLTIVQLAVSFKNNISQETLDIDSLNFSEHNYIHTDYLKEITETKKPENASRNDIALIHLFEDAPDDFQFTKLANSIDSEKVTIASTATLAGFGISTGVTKTLHSDPITNQQTVVKVVSDKSTAAGTLRRVDNMSVIGLISDSGKDIIFRQTNSVGACDGDSGGPALIKQNDGTFLQIGVASRVTGDLGNCNETSIYTNIATHRNWIEESLVKIKGTSQ